VIDALNCQRCYVGPFSFSQPSSDSKGTCPCGHNAGTARDGASLVPLRTNPIQRIAPLQVADYDDEKNIMSKRKTRQRSASICIRSAPSDPAPACRPKGFYNKSCSAGCGRTVPCPCLRGQDTFQPPSPPVFFLTIARKEHPPGHSTDKQGVLTWPFPVKIHHLKTHHPREYRRECAAGRGIEERRASVTEYSRHQGRGGFLPTDGLAGPASSNRLVSGSLACAARRFSAASWCIASRFLAFRIWKRPADPVHDVSHSLVT